ncbi:AbiEi antitoxin N-terminal domain-containing protein [Mesorhizobium hawassense]|uniref:AbiEi antitoxin N-terminal domain-containing protein n=1 Tax=Mesorhizobium hawassense TaxID=1209954 RepID=UPI001FE10AE9|nr:AbiEi antitoxin N-terminal domain-containing protein [Mesorhizobium hawassense]
MATRHRSSLPGELTWEKVIVSLQNLLGSNLVVGRRTALDLQGFSHYVSASGLSKIHLYGIDHEALR